MNRPINLEKQRVLDRIGYGHTARPSPRIVSLVEDYVDNYHEFIATSYASVSRDIIGVRGDRINLGGGLVLKSGVLATLLDRCEYVSIFVTTIGDYLEDIAAQLSESGLVLQSTVLDAIGSGVVEKLAARFQEKLQEQVAQEGMVGSRRFSPGYCDWDVSQQAILFEALGNDTAGVELTENMLMMPRKSVSGIIGIGKSGKDVEKYNPCVTCRMKDCPGRRK
jgi:hypothetical protein